MGSTYQDTITDTTPCKMLGAAPWILLVVSTMVCHALHPDDPRNLFANMYGGLYKRDGGEDDPRNLFANMYGGVFKRGASDDPRQLFADMYGGNYKRSAAKFSNQPDSVSHYQHSKRGPREDPRSLFKSIYGGVYRRR